MVSYVGYLGHLFCPVDLTIAYPRREVHPPLWQVWMAVLFLAGMTVAVVAGRRKYPYLLVGWFWYLGMLAPVIGIVQFGVQAEADRFTYLPSIGIGLMIAWGGADLSRTWRHQSRYMWRGRVPSADRIGGLHGMADEVLAR